MPWFSFYDCFKIGPTAKRNWRSFSNFAISKKMYQRIDGDFLSGIREVSGANVGNFSFDAKMSSFRVFILLKSVD